MSPLTPGEITEIVGPLSSGRTSLLTACLAETTARGACVALVDTDHVFDAEGATGAGVALGRLLWIRAGGARPRALHALDLLLRCPGFGLVVLDVGELVPRVAVTTPFAWKLAARRAGAALLIVGARPLAGAAAALVLRAERGGLEWSGPGATPTRLARVGSALRVVRRRGAPPAGGEHPDLRWWCA